MPAYYTLFPRILILNFVKTYAILTHGGRNWPACQTACIREKRDRKQNIPHHQGQLGAGLVLVQINVFAFPVFASMERFFIAILQGDEKL